MLNPNTDCLMSMVLGKETDPELLKIYLILDQKKRQPLNTEEFQKILQTLIFGFDDWQIIANVITAIVINSPEKSTYVLDLLTALFTEKEAPEYLTENGLTVFKRMRGINSATNPAFVNGLILGIFQAINWLNETWQTITTFEEGLPEFLSKLILRNEIEKYYQYDKKFEKKLSDNIKSYARPTRGRKYLPGQRLAQIMYIYIKIRWVWESGWELPKLNQLILEQLNYAIWGSISTNGRAQSIHLMFSSLINAERIFGEEIA